MKTIAKQCRAAIRAISDHYTTTERDRAKWTVAGFIGQHPFAREWADWNAKLTKLTTAARKLLLSARGKCTVNELRSVVRFAESLDINRVAFQTAGIEALRWDIEDGTLVT